MCSDPKILLLLKELQGRVNTKPVLSRVYAKADINRAKQVLSTITASNYTPDRIDVRELAAQVEDI